MRPEHAAGSRQQGRVGESIDSEASDRRDQYRLSEALAPLDRAYETYRGEGGPAP